MLYKVIKWRIHWKSIGEEVEMSEKEWKAYGEDYLLPIKVDKRRENKTSSSKDTNKWWSEWKEGKEWVKENWVKGWDSGSNDVVPWSQNKSLTPNDANKKNE